MNRFQVEPGLVLRPYVHSYWGVARDLSQTNGFAITPDRFMELIFFVNPPWVEDAAGRQALPVCTLIPLLHAPLRITSEGVVRCAAVRLHAWSAGLLFPQADTSAQPWFDVTPVFTEQAVMVGAALRRDATGEVVALLDQTMRRAFAGARPSPTALAAARTFVASPAEVEDKRTGVVASRQARSRRQVERQVSALTHRSPKQLASLARFQFVRDTLWAQPRKELAALAFEAGYADQAHLTRHFRRYAGQTPGGFLRDCALLKAALHRQEESGDVAILQDGRRER